VDEALLRRPSRFDRVFRVGLPAEAERREYCLRLLARPGAAALLEAEGGAGSPGSADAEGFAEEVARITGGFTPAHLKEAFIGAALEVAHGDAAALSRTFAKGMLENVRRIKSQISESREPEGLASASVRQLHDVLSGALEQATRWSLVPRNICSVVDPPRVVNEEFVPLDPKQSARFLEAASGDRYEALYVVALLRGLRQGELFGLMRKDLDLEARTLRVERQLQRMRDGSGLRFSEPKHGSKREMKLPTKTVDALGDHLERQAHEARMFGTRYEDQGLVFASHTGTPLDASNVVGRSFKPLLAGAGLPDIRFHDLRHTCATLLFLDGTHPKRVQQLLGHKSIAITLDRYSHWIPDLEDTTVDAMDRLF
jgi:integrase